jgi:hypothetical protein
MSALGIYVRWKAGEPREARTFPQIAPEHPLADLYCPACDDVLGNGDPVTLLVLGPGAGEDARERHREGRWFNAQALPVHLACLGGDPA